VYFFAGACLVLTGLLSLIGGQKLILDLAGFVYPAYMSFKSIDSGSHDDDTQWLTYWVVMAMFGIFESSCQFVVNFIPFYFWLRLGATVYLWHPSTRGAEYLYEHFLRPLLVPYLEKSGSGGATKKTE